VSQVIEDRDLDRNEDEDEDASRPDPLRVALAGIVSGLLLEGIDGGPFSVGAWALKSLGFGAVYLGWTVLWRFYQAGGESAGEDRSNPLM
jgi:hypothetical protein